MSMEVGGVTNWPPSGATTHDRSRLTTVFARALRRRARGNVATVPMATTVSQSSGGPP